MESFHSQLIGSLTWAVNQRDAAQSEAEGIGASLSEHMLSMQVRALNSSQLPTS